MPILWVDKNAPWEVVEVKIGDILIKGCHCASWGSQATHIKFHLQLSFWESFTVFFISYIIYFVHILDLKITYSYFYGCGLPVKSNPQKMETKQQVGAQPAA